MPETVLMNFYIPRRLKDRLEEICDCRHLSKTAFILTTIEPAIEAWERKLTLSARQVSGDDPPSFFVSGAAVESSRDW